MFNVWICSIERRHVPREAAVVFGAHGQDPLERRHVGGKIFEDSSTAAENQVASNQRLFDANGGALSAGKKDTKRLAMSLLVRRRTSTHVVILSFYSVEKCPCAMS